MTADQTEPDDTRDALAEVIWPAGPAMSMFGARLIADAVRAAGYVSPADHAAALTERDAGERSRMEWDDAMRQQERDRHAAALAQAKAEGGQEVAARVEAVCVDTEARIGAATDALAHRARIVLDRVRAALTPDAGAAHDRRVRAEALREAVVAAVGALRSHPMNGDGHNYGIAEAIKRIASLGDQVELNASAAQAMQAKREVEERAEIARRHREEAGQ